MSHHPVWYWLPNARKMRSWLVNPPIWVIAAIAVTISTCVWGWGGWSPFDRLINNAFFQMRQQWWGAQWDDRLAVIAIDEASLAEYGAFPWSRDRYQQLLETLYPNNPQVIVVDLLFAEPTEEDAALAEQMLKNDNVILALGWDAEGYPIPIAPAYENVAEFGHVYHFTDADGITRKAHLFLSDIPALGVIAVQLYQFFETGNVDPAIDSLPKTPVFINWPGSTHQLPTYSFADVINGTVDSATFRDRIVLIGVTATAVDSIQTPFDQMPPTAGLYFHAAVVDNILNQRLLRYTPIQFEFALIWIFGLGYTILLTPLSNNFRLLALILTPVVWIGIAFVCFLQFRLVIPVAAPLGTIVLSIGAVLLREQTEKNQLMVLFKQHVAPETADLIWRNRANIFQEGKLAPQEMIATVLFTDIRGFTSISENFPPQDVFNWLNRYLDVMSGCVIEHGGVIDKYIGDAIMAVFGVPFIRTEEDKIQQDALNAIAASIAMHERLQSLNQEYKQEGLPEIQFGVGIHTGLVMAGSVGGQHRLNYSVIGDTVNLAARLESLTKQLNPKSTYKILMSQDTNYYVSEYYSTVPTGTIQVRGRQEKVSVYTLGDLETIPE